MANGLISNIMAAYMLATASGGLHNGYDPGEGDIVLPPPATDNVPFVLHPPADVCKDIANGGDDNHPAPQDLPKEKLRIITADGSIVTIDVEIADTPEEQEIGLMYREEIPDGTGMLFTDVPKDENGEIGVWMKDTYVPLDIIFLDKDGKIVKIHEGAEACEYDKIMGGKDAYHILELPAGSVDLYGLEEGNSVVLPDQNKPDMEAEKPLILTKPERPSPVRPGLQALISTPTP